MAPPAPSIRLHEVRQLPIDQLMKAPWNANVVSPETLEKVRNSLYRYGSVENSVVRPSWCRGTRTSHEVRARQDTQMEDTTAWETLSGNHRLDIYQEAGVQRVPCVVVELSDPEAKVLAQVLNRQRGADDPERLAALLRDVAATMPVADMASLLPQTPQDIARLLGGPGLGDVGLPGGTTGEYQPIPMTEQFVVPPFSVLDTRQGYWKTRKKAWLSLGIRSELGRGDVLPNGEAGTGELSDSANKGCYTRQPVYAEDSQEPVGFTGTSIFDPVLCELAYRWFCPAGGHVLDPFAGGSVRGIVCAMVGRHYTGIDLSEQQVAANQEQATKLLDLPEEHRPAEGVLPRWLVGDARDIPALVPEEEFDLVFTCPPYADLERYSNDPRDLSTLEYAAFIAAYREVISKAVWRLRPNRFACFVVGDIRDPQGRYRNFVGHTVEAFQAAGCHLYNEAILVTALGSLPMRAGRYFRASRKLGKTHQNVLVFVKGDSSKATEACGKVEVKLPVSDAEGSMDANDNTTEPQ